MNSWSWSVTIVLGCQSMSQIQWKTFCIHFLRFCWGLDRLQSTQWGMGSISDLQAILLGISFIPLAVHAGLTMSLHILGHARVAYQERCPKSLWASDMTCDRSSCGNMSLGWACAPAKRVLVRTVLLWAHIQFPPHLFGQLPIILQIQAFVFSSCDLQLVSLTLKQS